MKSYRKNKVVGARMNVNESVIGERIEDKMGRLLRDKEPIKDLAPQIFTKREEGVVAAYDIRTDKFEVAAEARDKVAEQRELFKQAKKEGKVVKLIDDKQVIADKEPKGGNEGEGTGK